MPKHKDIDIINIVSAEDLRKMNEAQMVSVENIVPVSSKIVKEAQMDLSLNATRILRVIYSLITDKDVPNRKYRFDLQSYANAFNLSSAKIYRIMNEACEELRSSITLPIGKGRVTGLIDHAQITDNLVEIDIDPVVLDIFRKDKEKTSFKLQSVQNLAYVNTIKFYELCMLNLKDQDSVTFTMTISELRDFFKLGDKYKTTKDFRVKVIASSVMDINGEKPNEKSRIIENNLCNIHVDYTENMEKNKYVSITFTVTRIIKYEDEDPIDVPIITDFSQTLTPAGYDAYNWLTSQLKVAHSTIVHCVQDEEFGGEEKFLEIFEYIHYRILYDHDDIKNPVTWAANLLNNPKKFSNDLEYRKRLKERYKVLDENHEKVDLLNKCGITVKDRQLELIGFDSEYISLNAKYAEENRNKKDERQYAGFLYTAIKEDYAQVVWKRQVQLEEEAKKAAQAALAARISSMSDKELQTLIDNNEEGMLLAEKELELRKKLEVDNKTREADEAYNEFIATADADAKADVYQAMIANANSFVKAQLMRKYSVKDLNNISPDDIIKDKMFAPSYKGAFLKLMNIE